MVTCLSRLHLSGPRFRAAQISHAAGRRIRMTSFNTAVCYCRARLRLEKLLLATVRLVYCPCYCQLLVNSKRLFTFRYGANVKHRRGELAAKFTFQSSNDHVMPLTVLSAAELKTSSGEHMKIFLGRPPLHSNIPTAALISCRTP